MNSKNLSVRVSRPEKHFNEKCDQIVAEYRKRQAAENARESGLSAYEWLRSNTYEMILTFRDGPKNKFVRRRRDLKGRSRRGRPPGPNEFRDGLEAIFSDKAGPLDSKILWRLAKEIKFAAMHHVPPVFVNGFVSQCRKEDSDLKWSGTIHPTYLEWVNQEQLREASSNREIGSTASQVSKAMHKTSCARNSDDKNEDVWNENGMDDDPDTGASDDDQWEDED